MSMRNVQDMGFFQRLSQAAFINRPNRFVVECMLDGKPVRAYLPNPGRLRELLLPGRKIYLAKNASSSDSGMEFTAVAVERDGSPVMLHTHVNNEVARLLIEQGLTIARELYLGLVLDRAAQRPVLMASPAGGMEIEKVAAAGGHFLTVFHGSGRGGAGGLSAPAAKT